MFFINDKYLDQLTPSVVDALKESYWTSVIFNKEEDQQYVISYKLRYDNPSASSLRKRGLPYQANKARNIKSDCGAPVVVKCFQTPIHKDEDLPSSILLRLGL